LPAWFINPATHTRVAGFLFEGGRYSLAQALFPRASAIPSRKRYSLAQALFPRASAMLFRAATTPVRQ